MKTLAILILLVITVAAKAAILPYDLGATVDPWLLEEVVVEQEATPVVSVSSSFNS